MQYRIKNIFSQYVATSFWFCVIEIKKIYGIINEILFHRIRIHLTVVSSILLAMNGIYSNHHCTSRKRRISMSVQQVSLILIYLILKSLRRMMLWIILYDVNGIIPSQLEIKYSTISQHQMDSYKYWTLLNILYMFVQTVKNNNVQVCRYFQTYIDVKIT